jgi:alanine racemase
MRRIGLDYKRAFRNILQIASLKHLELEGIFTHFASAEEKNKSFARIQLERFNDLLNELRKTGIEFPIIHAANSGAVLDLKDSYYNMVRPGLLLYGIVPPPLATEIDLRPALSLTSRIVAVKGVRDGEGTGYGLRWRAEGPRTIAIVPAGYADGLDTRMSGRASVLVRGRRVPVVGSVCMDMLMIDVSGLDVSPGDEVVIIGRQETEAITAREMAAAIGTIPWEVVCRLGARIERQYQEQGWT